MKWTLLTIVIALSLLAAAQISDRPGLAAPTPPQPPAAANAPSLNVIFHGLFAFVVWRDHIEVLAPQVDDHVYKAGSWGNEMRLKENVTTYSLVGVRGAAQVPDIDPTTNVVLEKVTNIDRNKSKLFCSIKFPLPAEIKSLRRVPAKPSEMFGGDAAAHLQCRQVPLLEVFVYPIEDLKKLSLDYTLPDHTLAHLPWQPSMNAVNTVNLHVWAEPEALVSPLGGSHSTHAFTQLMALFPKVKLELRQPGTAVPDTQTNIRGLSPFEQNTLLERSHFMNTVPVNVPGPAAGRGASPSGGGSDVTTCLPLMIRNDGK